MDTLALIVIVGAALFFTFTNGFHDSAHTIATSLSTRALTPRVALVMAAFMNLAGAFLGSGVATTVSEDLIDTPGDGDGLVLLAAALLGALAWSAAAWYASLPFAATQALLGGLLGAALAAAVTVHWETVATAVVLPIVLAPVIGLVLGRALMVGILWLFRRAQPRRAQRRFRMAQTVSAAAMALAHGLQDAQKTMAVVVMALVAADVEQAGGGVPLWVRIACAVSLALGTYAGGWFLLRTLGRRITELDPPGGFAAETATSSVLYAASYVFHAPVSTTHVITAAIAGAGTARRRSTVRWGVAKGVLTGWVLTMPAAAGIAALAYAVLAVTGWAITTG